MQKQLNELNSAIFDKNYEKALKHAICLESMLDPRYTNAPNADHQKILEKICQLADKCHKKELVPNYAFKLLFYDKNNLDAMLYLANALKDIKEQLFYLSLAKPFIQKIIGGGEQEIRQNIGRVYSYLFLTGRSLSKYGAKEQGLKMLKEAQEYAKKYDEKLLNLDFYIALGSALGLCGKYEEAIQTLTKSYQNDKNEEGVLTNISFLMLRSPCKENLKTALLCYERRFKEQPLESNLAKSIANAHTKSLLAFEQNGRSNDFLKGKTVVLFPRQGFGDTLMYLRYLPHLTSLAGEVIFFVQKPLQSLLYPFLKEKFINLSCFDGGELKNYDFAMPYCSLPLFFAKDYIQEPLMLKEAKILHKKPKKIGIFWKTEDHRGSSWGNTGEGRSFDLEYLLDVLDGYELFSFQVKPNAKEKELFLKHNITDLGSDFKDFKDTFLAFDKIDMLVCADTAIAHLALISGVKTAIILPYDFDFRWGRYENPSSPWYKDALLFACDYLNEWQSATKKLKNYLNSL